MWIDSPTFCPLRVSALLSTSWATDGRMSLDGLLIYWYYQNHPELHAPDGCNDDVPIPLGRVSLLHADGTPDFVWACSWPCADWRPETEGLAHEVKRVRRGLAATYTDTRRVETQGGRYKDWRKPVMYHAVNVVDWYVVGDPDAIRAGLANVRSLGKLRGHGWGLVREWRVDEVGFDWSVVGPDARLMRSAPSLPDGVDAQSAIPVFGAWRPPYWHPERQGECWAPVELLSGIARV